MRRAGLLLFVVAASAVATATARAQDVAGTWRVHGVLDGKKLEGSIELRGETALLTTLTGRLDGESIALVGSARRFAPPGTLASGARALVIPPRLNVRVAPSPEAAISRIVPRGGGRSVVRVQSSRASVVAVEREEVAQRIRSSA